jgi:hypothetical protein
MTRRPTLCEELWPKDAAFDCLRAWPRDFAVQLLSRIWQAFDQMRDLIRDRIRDWSNLEQVERSLTSLHFDQVADLQTGDEPFLPTRETPEFSSRRSAMAMPRSSDFGFKIRGGDLSLIWPIEAKVLRRPDDVAEYLGDLTEKYLGCLVGPYCPEGGLIGYLVEGDPNAAFDAIAAGINQPMASHLSFAERPHRTSDHKRVVPEGKPFSAAFRCHHLIMQLQVEINAAAILS